MTDAKSICDNVRVIARLRPVLKGGQICVNAISKDAVEVLQQTKNTLERGKKKGDPPRRTVFVSRKQWHLDAVYTQEVSTMDVYISEVDRMVEKVVEFTGHAVCIMAFGQTGSGKTFTISGNEKNPGIMQLAAIHLTDAVDSYNAECDKEEDMLSIYLSAGEVYQEQLLDLGVELDMDERGKPRRMTPATLRRCPVGTAEELIKTLESMISRRASGATNKNEHSSRSHAVYTISIEKNSDPMVPVGMLGLADLAGAEYASATEGCDEKRRAEGGKNNLGLMTLKAAFRYMSETASSAKTIPFSWHRSTLTRLLKPFLLEASMARYGSLVLLVTASVEQQDVEQTVQALSDGVALIGRAAAETEVINLGGEGGVVVVGDAESAATGAVAFRPASAPVSRLDALSKSRAHDTVPKKAFVRAGSGISAGRKGTAAASTYGRAKPPASDAAVAKF